MMTLSIKFLVYAGAVFAVGKLLPGIHVPDFMTALLVALVLGVINMTIRPIVKILTFPINILTLGVVGFVINTLFFWSATLVVKTFVIDGFWWAALGAFVVSTISAIGNRIALGSDGKFGDAS